ncbi:MULTISPECIES: DinB family protein [unclassified Lacinutrix]
MNWAFDITLRNRKLLESIMENHTLEQLNKVPEGFNNNMIWNIAHTIVTQQLLVYKLSTLPSVLSEEMIETYRKGTKTERDVTQAEVNEIKGLLFSTIEKTKEDYDNKRFKNYNEYMVSTKGVLTNVEEAIDFNSFHEGIHLGYILALKRSL